MAVPPHLGCMFLIDLLHYLPQELQYQNPEALTSDLTTREDQLMVVTALACAQAMDLPL